MQRRATPLVLVAILLASIGAAATAAEPDVIRLAGPDRFATAVAISEHHHPAGAVLVIVASGADFPDGLAGGAVAGRLGAPVLLTRPDTLPQVTRDEILRLDPGTILLLGGPAAVSVAVEAELAGLAPTTRLAGTNRYETAAEVSKHVFGDGEASTVVIATGAGFADALAGAPLAAAFDGPVLLTRPDSLPTATRDEILRLDPDAILLLGGPAAVASGVEADLADLAPTTRLAGANRYETAAEVARHGFASAGAVYVAVGTDFPDALAGAGAAALTGSPVLLTTTTGLSGPTRDEILRLDPNTAYVLGGAAVITDEVAAQLADPASLAFIDLAFVEVASGFQRPVFVTSRPGDPRLFVVEQGGRIWSMQPNGSSRAVVLDISAKVRRAGNEQGLLGIAFDPADPSRLFVHYTAEPAGATTIERHHFPLGAAAANPEPAATVLTHPQPFSNHNGGMLAFGPDGFLYVALGDGGSGDDPLGHGQDPSTLLGAMLRLDVSGPGGYAIPPDNPFADGIGGAPEVWAYGLRNPWRFSFDGDLLYIGDVGQNRREEVNLLHTGDGGANLGWAVMEGTLCNDDGNPLCDDNDFVDPIHEYSIQGESRCAITGGYVSRRQQAPSLWGVYVFGDFCTGEIMGLRVWQGTVVAERVFPLSASGLSSFGVDSDGRLYVTRLGAGTVLRLVEAG